MRHQSFYSLYIEIKSNNLSVCFIGFSQLQNETHFVSKTPQGTSLLCYKYAVFMAIAQAPVLCTPPSDSLQAGLMVGEMSASHRNRPRAWCLTALFSSLLLFLCPTDLYHCYLQVTINPLTTLSGQITYSRTPTSRPRPQENHVDSWAFLFAKRATRKQLLGIPNQFFAGVSKLYLLRAR